MKKGSIRVQTENIFPIIKKFLYSDHDIFIRELVSNAVDAIQKLKALQRWGNIEKGTETLAVRVAIDKDKKTITISDDGIGMSEEEVEKYINQVAFSGAQEFLNQYKEKNDTAIIGHFGLGFYSAFMVSTQVVIETRSAQKDTPAVRWTCDGSTEYVLEPIEKKDSGTDIILHINEDSLSFLEADTLRGALRKFCRFLPAPVFFEDKQINDTQPLWLQKPADLEAEAYQKFYKELFPFSEAPLFWIHLNVDYPFKLTGVLYFPLVKESYEIQKNKIALYCNQVYVTDEVQGVVPEFLMLLHGVIDSPDIPLNVSRSYLQTDANVKKISRYISKKVSDKLEEMFKKERPAFEEKWTSLQMFVKYGMMTEESFLEKANQYLLLQSTEGTYYTLSELKEKAAALQTDKNGDLVVPYTTDKVKQHSYIAALKAYHFVIIEMGTLIDTAFINQIETKWEKVKFKRVDSDLAHLFVEKEGAETAVTLSEAEQTRLKELIVAPQRDNTRFNVEIKALSAEDLPVSLVQSEWMRRMKDMGAISGEAGKFYAQMPSEYTVVVNAQHPVIQKVVVQSDNAAQKAVVKELFDLALLAQGMLEGEALAQFIQDRVAAFSKD